MHKDGQTVVKEKIYLDKSDPNILNDEIWKPDDAPSARQSMLTQPWTHDGGRHARSPLFGLTCGLLLAGDRLT
jgi:hypothetical protein